jgi:hypothetical protein
MYAFYGEPGVAVAAIQQVRTVSDMTGWEVPEEV